MTQKYKFGEIWVADLNPRMGTEPGKTRPVLIVQSKFLLEANHPSTIILPLTTKLIDNVEPLRIRIKAQENLDKDSDITIDQIRAIDNRRLINEPLLRCNKEFMERIGSAFNDVLGFNNTFII